MLYFAILLIVIFYAAYSDYYRLAEYSEAEFLMDTIVKIKVQSRNKAADQVIAQTFELMRLLETKFSCYQEEGIIYQFNAGEIDSLYLDDDLQQILSMGRELYSQTDSLYDITIGRLADLWDFNEPIKPKGNEITEALELIGFDKLKISRGYLFKPQGMKLTLGSLAKGYIIDRAVDFLKTRQIESGFVNAGGDMRIFGQKKPLKIGIQHPRSDRGELIGTLLISDLSVVTSGDYERFFIEDGIRYHHILDPKTGYPAVKTVSVTVLSEQAFIGDAYSTALFLLEPQQAIELVNSKENLEAKIFYLEADELKSLESEGMKFYLK